MNRGAGLQNDAVPYYKPLLYSHAHAHACPLTASAYVVFQVPNSTAAQPAIDERSIVRATVTVDVDECFYLDGAAYPHPNPTPSP